MAEKVTAGRDALGDFAPTFAALNDDVLFEQVWSREEFWPKRAAEHLLAPGTLDAAMTDRVHRSLASAFPAA